MGAWLSGMEAATAEAGSLGTGLDDLPESCIAEVLRQLSPQEICRAARLSRVFRGAASADFVWETKLPKNYRYLVGLASGKKTTTLCKKEIYARLCRPNTFHGGFKVFWLERSRGGMCLSISCRALQITGIDDRRYWKHLPTDESRFSGVAYLQQTWWFEVTGELDFCFPAGAYSLFFRLHLGRASRRFGRRTCNSEHVHGWDRKPVRFQLSASNGQQALSQCYLADPGSWIHYHAGDFVVDRCDAPTKVKFSMTQIDCTHTKGGLCVDSVLVCPRDGVGTACNLAA